MGCAALHTPTFGDPKGDGPSRLAVSAPDPIKSTLKLSGYLKDRNKGNPTICRPTS